MKDRAYEIARNRNYDGYQRPLTSIAYKFGQVWAADLAEMKSLSSKNKNFKSLLCVIDVFTKYAWVKPLKDKKG